MKTNKIRAIIHGIYQLIIIEIKSMITVMKINNSSLPNEEKRRKINEISLMKIQSTNSLLEWLSLID